jgi:hypothetical protein
MQCMRESCLSNSTRSLKLTHHIAMPAEQHPLLTRATSNIISPAVGLSEREMNCIRRIKFYEFHPHSTVRTSS